MKRRIVSSLVCAVLLGVAPSALASVSFPEALRQELNLAAVPPPAPGCRLCHSTDAGGLKTVTTPFGRSMLTAGTTAANVPSMLASLRALETDGTDSDRDGTPDITELEAGTDPNVAQAPDGMPVQPTEAVPLPETGCALRAAPATGVSGWVGLGLLWLLVRARRR